MRVGHAKANCIRIRFSGKSRLSIRVVAKGQASGLSIQVAAEDGSEHSTSCDKVLAVSPKIEPLRPRLFIRGKIVEEALNL
jgi:hypothetical protein